MEKKKLTKKDWQEFVSNNCENSYSLAVCLAIMLLWEEPNVDPNSCLEGIGLSGAQAEMAISFVKNHDFAVTNLQENPLSEEREDIINP